MDVGVGVVFSDVDVVFHTEYGEGIVSVYTCCGERRDSPGCQVAKVSSQSSPLPPSSPCP